MRIVHIHFGKDGGAEKFFVKLANGLARRGVSQKIVIRPGRPWRKDFHEDVEVFAESHFRSLSIDRWTLPQKFKRLLKTWQPDAILGWMSRSGYLIPKQCECPTFLRLGDYQDSIHQFAHVDNLICNTPGVEQRVREIGWSRRTHVVTNFTSMELVKPIARQELNTPSNVPLICAVGRLVARKGFEVILRALHQLSHAHLWIVGDGQERSMLESLASELGVAPRVCFVGWVDDPRRYIAAADISAMASSHEALGNVILEGWAQHKPVVATRSEGPSWLVQDGVNGLLVDIGDHDGMAHAIQRILLDEALAQQLVNGGAHSLNQQFSEDAVISKYLSVLSNATSQSRAA